MKNNFRIEGVKHHNLGEHKKAIELYKRALALEESPILYYNITIAYFSLKDYNGFEEWFSKLQPFINKLDHEKKAAVYYFYAWYCYNRNKNPAKAYGYITEATRLKPNNPRHLDNLVRIAFELAEKEDAMTALARLWVLHPGFGDSQDLFEKYKREINAYLEKFHKNDNIKATVSRILKLMNAPSALINYVVDGTAVAGYYYFYKWEQSVEKMAAYPIPLDSPFMIRLYKAAIEKKSILSTLGFLNKNLRHNIHGVLNIIKNFNNDHLAVLCRCGSSYASDLYYRAACYLTERNEPARALEYCKNAVYIYPGKAEYHYLAYRISTNPDNREEGLSMIARCYRIDPGFQAAAGDYKKHEKKIKSYLENFWKHNNREKILEKTITVCQEEETSTTTRDIFNLISGASSKTGYYYNYILKDIAEVLIREFFDYDDPYLLNIYRAAVENNDAYYIFRFLEDHFDTGTTGGMEEILQLLAKSGMDRITTAREAIKQLNPGDQLTGALESFLLPDYADELEDFILKKANLKEKKIFSAILLKHDYNNHIDCIKDMLNIIPPGENCNSILKLITDTDFIMKNILLRTGKWIEKAVTATVFNKKIEKPLLDFLKTGTMNNNLEKNLFRLAKKIRKTSLSFHDALLYRIPRECSQSFLPRLNYTGAILDTYGTLPRFFAEHTIPGKPDIEEFIKIIDKNKLPASTVTDYLAMYCKKKNHTGLLKWYIKNDYKAALAGIERSENTGREQGAEILWKTAKEKSFDFLLNSLGGASSKQVRNKIVNLLAGYEKGFERVIKQLETKKQNVRETAVRLLLTYNRQETGNILRKHYQREKGKKVLTVLNEFFAKQTRGEDCKITSLTKETVLEKAKHYIPMGQKEPVSGIKWLSLQTMPTLLWKEDRSELPLEAVYYFISTFARVKNVVPDYEGRQAGSLIEKESLLRFVHTVYDRWDQNSKTKWVLAMVAAFGDDSFIAPLVSRINELIKHSRGAMAAYLVQALAQTGTPGALKMTDYIARMERHKQVKRAAKKALETAAAELNLSKDDLLDRIIPDFGLSKSGTMVLDFGPRRFTIILTGDLSFQITDNNRKVYKNLPKPGKKDDPEKAAGAVKKFKALKQGIKDQVKMERERLEWSFIKKRIWSNSNWRTLFTGNPVMREFATGLIWGYYQDGKLIDTFRFMDDGTFNNSGDREHSFSGEYDIGLVHPIEIAGDSLKEWQEQIRDYEIKQPFKQLDRPVFKVPAEKRKEIRLEDFQGYMINPMSLQGKLFKAGWNRGSVQDAGCFYTYYKEIKSRGIGVELNFMGDCVGYSMHDSVPLYHITFYMAGTVKRGSYVYDTPGETNTLELGEVPPRIYSEIYYEIKKIAESGTGIDPDWESISW